MRNAASQIRQTLRLLRAPRREERPEDPAGVQKSPKGLEANPRRHRRRARNYPLRRKETSSPVEGSIPPALPVSPDTGTPPPWMCREESSKRVLGFGRKRRQKGTCRGSASDIYDDREFRGREHAAEQEISRLLLASDVAHRPTDVWDPIRSAFPPSFVAQVNFESFRALELGTLGRLAKVIFEFLYFFEP